MNGKKSKRRLICNGGSTIFKWTDEPERSSCTLSSCFGRSDERDGDSPIAKPNQTPPSFSPKARRLRPLPAMAPGALARLLRLAPTPRLARPFAAKARASRRPQEPELPSEDDNDFAGGEVAAPTEGIGRPLAEVLKELRKRVPDSLVKTRVEDNGFAIKYIPW